MPDITVVVCTYNRASLLPRALDSLLNQESDRCQFEILVVDNNSTDATRNVVADYQTQRSNIRYVIEPEQGIAYARNRALREATGDYIAFLDDDAWAESTWLESLFGSVSLLRPTPACVVGPVILEWEGDRPSWFPEQYESLLCAYDLGSSPYFLDENGYLLTTNVLFHRPTVLDLGGFRPYLGRKGNRPLGGEDNDMYQRLIRAGYKIYYHPDARVHHGVPKERQTRRYLVQRLFWDGASQPLMALSQLSERGEQYRPAYEAYIDLRRCGRFSIDIIRNLMLGRFAEGQEAFLHLVQRLGRLRTHLGLALGFSG